MKLLPRLVSKGLGNELVDAEELSAASEDVDVPDDASLFERLEVLLSDVAGTVLVDWAESSCRCSSRIRAGCCSKDWGST